MAPKSEGRNPEDRQLIQIVDAALLLASQKSGAWLVCKPGCTQCCVGVFPIHQLDAARLRGGLAELTRSDPERADRVRGRVGESLHRLSADFPGDARSGRLDPSPEGREAFADFANEEPCPVLDPATGTCDLYTHRPMTCRVFGPPVRSEEGIGICELCYHGASPEEIAACEMVLDTNDLESALVEQMEERTGIRGETIVTFALASAPRP